MNKSNFAVEASDIIKDFLYYLQTIKGRSPSTVDEYFTDLRTFFRFIKVHKHIVPTDTPYQDIPVDDVDLELISSVTLTDGYEFMNYLVRVRHNDKAARARKTTSVKSFYAYLTDKKHLLSHNPLNELERPNAREKNPLPKYLTLEQSIELLNAVEGKYKERDYCILTFFLNCGMRLAELVSMDYNDIRSDHTAQIVGKGNKKRIIYLNDACMAAFEAYMKVRPVDGVRAEDKYALFLSSQHRRISRESVQKMVYKYLDKIGLGSQGYSVHKLRHTAATLMYQHGNVDIRVLKDVLGHENLSTTEIYTHLDSSQIEAAAKSNPLSKVKPKRGS
ncbi:tyrosine recombinase XerC [Ruminococcus sp.]|uniref:tyrosine recombinase XerC n=1 Tax=Ruminococcus sp. TaxID=41978 RepID=UPI003890E3F4